MQSLDIFTNNDWLNASFLFKKAHFWENMCLTFIYTEVSAVSAEFLMSGVDVLLLDLDWPTTLVVYAVQRILCYRANIVDTIKLAGLKNGISEQFLTWTITVFSSCCLIGGFWTSFFVLLWFVYVRLLFMHFFDQFYLNE